MGSKKPRVWLVPPGASWYVVSVGLSCCRLDRIDNSIGLGLDVALAGKGAEAGAVVSPGLVHEGGEVLCGYLYGAETCPVVAVGLVLVEALGSEAVGDEGVPVGVAEVDTYKHKGSFSSCDGGFRLRLGVWSGGRVVVRRGSEDVVGPELVDRCLPDLVFGRDLVGVGLVAGALVADDNDVSAAPRVGRADDDVAGLHGVPGVVEALPACGDEGGDHVAGVPGSSGGVACLACGDDGHAGAVHVCGAAGVVEPVLPVLLAVPDGDAVAVEVAPPEEVVES